VAGKLRVLVIGSGVIGASIARVLTRYFNFDVLIVEREPDVGWGVSKANTSIIHPGHEEDPDRYPLRAELCVRGNELWRKWVQELSILARWPGELIMYTSSDEGREVRKYIEFARRNRVPGVRLLDRSELLNMEPSASEDSVGALYAPTAGLISPFEAVVAIVENSVENDAKLLVETEVRGVRVSSGRVVGVETSRGFIEADLVVNAAGLYADIISHMAGVEVDFKITSRKGQYILFDEEAGSKPRFILHTTPTTKTKGVYAVTTVHDNLMIGPTAEDLPWEAKDDTSTTPDGVEYLYREARKLLRTLPPRSRIIRFFAGLRPEPPDGQWLIKAYTDPWGFVNVAGIRSPGLTAAPAIAEYVLKLIAEIYDIKLVEKPSWNPYRRDTTRVKGRSLHEIDELVKSNPDYGEIVCYCKMVSKAEVLEAIERIKRIGAKVTVDGVKFRVYAGFGKCQGSFCRWRVASIISRELAIPLHGVLVKHSTYGVGDVKSVWREMVRAK